MIAIYIVGGLGIGFSMGILAAAVYLEYRMQKRMKDLKQLVGRRGNGKYFSGDPHFYLDQNEEYEDEEESEEEDDG